VVSSCDTMLFNVTNLGGLELGLGVKLRDTASNTMVPN